MAITKQDIFAVADRLKAEGTNPTLAAVRRALGGGSFTTISEAMNEWKAAHQPATAGQIREPAPAVVSERLAAFAGELWTIALDMANGRLQTERDALEQARQELDASRQEAADLADELSADLERAQASIERQTEAAATAAAQIERQAAEIHRLGAVLAEASDRAHTAEAALNESRERVGQLSGLLEAERKAREEAITEARKSGEEAAELRGRLAASTTEDLIQTPKLENTPAVAAKNKSTKAK